MKTNVAAIWCLAAYLCGCASPGRHPQAVVPTAPSTASTETTADNGTLAQRADRFAGRLREKAAQVPTKTQSMLDNVGDSEVVTCLLPVLMVGCVVFAILSGSQIGPLNFSPPAPASS